MPSLLPPLSLIRFLLLFMNFSLPFFLFSSLISSFLPCFPLFLPSSQYSSLSVLIYFCLPYYLLFIFPFFPFFPFSLSSHQLSLSLSSLSSTPSLSLPLVLSLSPLSPALSLLPSLSSPPSARSLLPISCFPGMIDVQRAGRAEVWLAGRA